MKAKNFVPKVGQIVKVGDRVCRVEALEIHGQVKVTNHLRDSHVRTHKTRVARASLEEVNEFLKTEREERVKELTAAAC